MDFIAEKVEEAVIHGSLFMSGRHHHQICRRERFLRVFESLIWLLLQVVFPWDAVIFAVAWRARGIQLSVSYKASAHLTQDPRTSTMVQGYQWASVVPSWEVTCMFAKSPTKLKGLHYSLGMVPSRSWSLNHPQGLSSEVLLLQSKPMSGSCRMNGHRLVLFLYFF